MRLTQLADKLVDVCKEYGLEYDPNNLPIKLTADCYIISATEIDYNCKSHGQCREIQYYAITGGDTIKITEIENK